MTSNIEGAESWGGAKLFDKYLKHVEDTDDDATTSGGEDVQNIRDELRLLRMSQSHAPAHGHRRPSMTIFDATAKQQSAWSGMESVKKHLVEAPRQRESAFRPNAYEA